MENQTVYGDLALTIRDTPKVKSVQYCYRISVPIGGADAMLFGVRGRQMYALAPRIGNTWEGLLGSPVTVETGIELVRLEGAAEEE